MATKTTTARFEVTIHPGPAGLGGGDIPGFLDMLRYEGGRVVDWRHSDGSQNPGYTVTIDVTPAYSHQPDRWSSFLLPVTEAVIR